MLALAGLDFTVGRKHWSCGAHELEALPFRYLLLLSVAIERWPVVFISFILLGKRLETLGPFFFPNHTHGYSFARS